MGLAILSSFYSWLTSVWDYGMGQFAGYTFMRGVFLFKDGLYLFFQTPKKVKTPSGDRFASRKPIIPDRGGRLYPFVKTDDALEMRRELMIKIFKALLYIFGSFIIYIFRNPLLGIGIVLSIVNFIVWVGQNTLLKIPLIGELVRMVPIFNAIDVAFSFFLALVFFTFLFVFSIVKKVRSRIFSG